MQVSRTWSPQKHLNAPFVMRSYFENQSERYVGYFDPSVMRFSRPSGADFINYTIQV